MNIPDNFDDALSKVIIFECFARDYVRNIPSGDLGPDFSHTP